MAQTGRQSIASFSLSEAQSSFLKKILPPNYSFQIHHLGPRRDKHQKLLDPMFTNSDLIEDFIDSSPEVKLKNDPLHVAESDEDDRIVEPSSNMKNSGDVEIVKRVLNTCSLAEIVSEEVFEEQFMGKKEGKDYEVEACVGILKKLQKFKSARPFLYPVDPILQGVPEYPTIVKHPIGLSDIEKKLKTDVYKNAAEFHLDVHRIFSNSYKFNPKGSRYFTLTCQTEDYYYKLLERQGEKDKGPSTESDSEDEVKNAIKPPIQKYSLRIQKTKPSLSTIFNPQDEPSLRPVKTRYTESELVDISERVTKLSGQRLQEIIQIVYPEDIGDTRGNFVINLSEMSLSRLRMIEAITLKG